MAVPHLTLVGGVRGVEREGGTLTTREIARRRAEPRGLSVPQSYGNGLKPMDDFKVPPIVRQ